MFDVTKSWTFDYVKREAPKVPKHIPLLILANFIDQAHHRCISRSQAIGYVRAHVFTNTEFSISFFNRFIFYRLKKMSFREQ